MVSSATPTAPKPFAAHLLLLLLLLSLLFCCFGVLRSDAQGLLPKQEIDALKRIDSKLKVGWDFSVNPCNGDRGWLNATSPEVTRNLTCSRNSTTNVCHVVSIQLKSQNLTGVLPPDFAGLPFLEQIDLSLNYINGTLPAAWASLSLVDLSVMGNRLTGQIPVLIGNITTLKSLVLDDNLFEGSIPSSLGRLTNLNSLILSSNNFIGELPETLGQLKNLRDFMIDATGISGKIPSFIGNWTSLQRLYLQGTSMEGPFPSIFPTLRNLTELKVTDLKGGGSFPSVRNTSLINLTLRNCSISGPLPDYIGEMSLKYLDLSFNNLIGEIPSSFATGLANTINYMYLSNNMLNGSIPGWIMRSPQHMDVSYNLFTPSSSENVCQQGNVNLVASSLSSDSNQIKPCLRKDYPCLGKPTNYNLFINCGGGKVNIEGQEYDDDSSSQGPSTFFSGYQNWAYSSTGSFVNNGQAQYTATNISVLNMTNPELYMSARLNPLSLRYYGLCLQKGNYTAKLHFAEIMFTDDQTFSSIGRRLFDVSIQGKKVLEDFNIAEEAGGVGRALTKNFTAVVDNSTLEIHFQWAGKGTLVIPYRGVYGPLISAISVTPNFQPDLGETKTILSVSAIVGIVAALFVVIVLILFFLWFCVTKKRREKNELKGLELQTAYFSLRQIKSATRNFDPANKIGEGGFGPVYKGVLPDGVTIAVKQLSSKSRQGNREFVNEIGMISALQHPNLVKLFGCCIEGNQLLLIYEYMENNSLANALFGCKGTQPKLDWQTRRKICLGIARGLTYLHEESRLKIVHRDIKATNVLLDKDLNAKISDFGLAKLNEEENTHISTRIAGTVGYMAPEYAMRGYLTNKADVYSFGVVLLEIVSGKSNTNYRPEEEFMFLLDWAYTLKEKGNLLDLVDSHLGSNYPKEEALQFLNLALVCASPSPALRPTISTVVSMLEGQMPVQPSYLKDVSSDAEEITHPSFENLSYDHLHDISEDVPWLGSSVSATSSKEGSAIFSQASKILSNHTE